MDIQHHIRNHKLSPNQHKLIELIIYIIKNKYNQYPTRNPYHIKTLKTLKSILYNQIYSTLEQQGLNSIRNVYYTDIVNLMDDTEFNSTFQSY